MLKLELVPAAGDKLVLKLSPPLPPLADNQASLADNTTDIVSGGGNAVGIHSEPVSLKDGIDTGTGGTGTASAGNVPSEGESGSLAGVHFAGVSTGVSLDAVPEASRLTFTVDDPAGAKAVGLPPESEPGPLKDGIDAGGGNVAGELSPMKSFAQVGIVPADDGRITLVISASVSPSLFTAKACGVKNVNISVAKSGPEGVLKKDPAAEKAPGAAAVDSDKAKAMFGAHAPSPPAVFWSKFTRPTGPPTAPTGAVKGALKKDIPAAESGAEVSSDETGAINDPALKPATKVATALKPAAVCGETLPSIKEFPEPAQGDDGWTVSAKEFPKGEPDWIVSNSRNRTERKGEVKSTKVSNKYDLLEDAETNVKAENGEDEDEKTGKEKGTEKESSFESVSPESVGGIGKAPRGSTPLTTDSGATANPKTTTTATPRGSVSASGWLSWPKLCWHNALCSVFICLIVVSAGGGAFAYFSHGSDNLLPSIVLDATALPTERGPLFAPFNPTPDPVVPDPPNVVEDPNWLIATSGFCSNLNVVMNERDVEASETPGDRDGHFVADISFNYYPQTAVKFTDFPYHKANTIEGDKNEADALVASAWDHKNIALLEPTSTCSANEQNDLSWGISVFKVEEHRHCIDSETAWEGHPCVHYTGYVSAETSNFVNVNEARFPCQLFVDSAIFGLFKSVDHGSDRAQAMTEERLSDAKVAAQFVWASYWYGPGVPGTTGCFDPSMGNEAASWAVQGDDRPRRGMHCGPKLQDWDFQGRIVAKYDNGVDLSWVPLVDLAGYADADVYYGSEAHAGICYVVIRGTNDKQDLITDVRNGVPVGIPSDNPQYYVGYGFKMYYDTLRPLIKDACAGKTATWFAGHSLGGAAAEIGVAYGDADRSITFGTPKAFVEMKHSGEATAARKIYCKASEEKMKKIGRHFCLETDLFHRPGTTCRVDGGRLPNSMSFYNADRAKNVVDPVTSVSAMETNGAAGTHCAEHHFEIYQYTTKKEKQKWMCDRCDFWPFLKVCNCGGRTLVAAEYGYGIEERSLHDPHTSFGAKLDTSLYTHKSLVYKDWIESTYPPAAPL